VRHIKTLYLCNVSAIYNGKPQSFSKKKGGS